MSGFRMASLDRFVNKVHKKYFIKNCLGQPKKKVRSGFVRNKMAVKCIRKSDSKIVREMTVEMSDCPAFGGVLYILSFLQFWIEVDSNFYLTSILVALAELYFFDSNLYQDFKWSSHQVFSHKMENIFPIRQKCESGLLLTGTNIQNLKEILSNFIFTLKFWMFVSVNTLVGLNQR